MTTFILRLVGEQGGALRGTVSHAATGETRRFAETAQLLSFLEEWSAVADIRAAATDGRALARPAGSRDGHRAPQDKERVGPDNPHDKGGDTCAR